MNAMLWAAQALLAAGFASSGATKYARSRAQLHERYPWVEDFSDRTVKLIGTAELLGAIGLLLPPLLDIAPWLAALAAASLAAMMALAGLTHLRRNEPPGIAVTLALAAIAVFVAWGRFGPHPF